MSALKLIVAAGGTGGDLFPAVAVVEQLQKRGPVEAIFVGNPERIEAQVVPQLGFRFEALSVRGFKGLRHVSSYVLPFRILGSTLKVRSLIASFKPDLALCAGTYISYPLAVAASMAKLPLVLIESNAIPGKANKSVARRADMIIAAFDEACTAFQTKHNDVVHVIGNPIRNGFSSMPTREAGAAAFGLNAKAKTLLVFGGSLGARSINSCIAEHLTILRERGIQVLWQCGKNYEPPVDLPSGVRILPFIDDMASAYSCADLVLCRAGGGTVAELKVAAKPAVLIPYPYAANNEQEHNAAALELRGAARMIRDGELSSQFSSVCLPLIENKALLDSMSQAMASLARPNAASDAAELILGLVSKHS